MSDDSTGREADDPTAHDADRRPYRSGERPGLPPEDLIVGTAARPRDRRTYAQRVVDKHVDESDDGAEERCDEDEDPSATCHERGC